MKLALVSLLALSACSPDRTSNGDGGAAAAPAVGRTVTEIDPRIWCIHEDQQGTLWLGSNGSGVYRYDGQQIVNVTSANGLSGDQVRNIQDANGTVFISTTGGVTAFDGTAFTRLEPEAPTDGDGWRLDPDDVWLVANPGIGGPCRYDGERLHQLELSESPAEAAHRAKYPGTDFPPDAVYCTYTDHRGHVWFGTAAVGLCRYDGATLSWMFEDHLTTTPSGGAFGIRSIYQDRGRDFWICNTRYRFQISTEVAQNDGSAIVVSQRTDGLPEARSDTDGNFVYYHSMLEDDAGSLWMACGSDGVWSYDGAAVTRFNVGDGAYVICLERDQAGRIWAGTVEHGVYIFEGDRFMRFEPSE